MDKIAAKLKVRFKKIRFDVPLKDYTSWRIGGNAKYFIEAKSADELKSAILFAKKNGLAWHILAGGTNVLFSDKGFDGLIVRSIFDKFEIHGERILAYGGANLQSVILACVRRGLSGLENLAGIPGTIAGAIRGNAGTQEAEIGDVVESVKIFDAKSGRIKTMKRNQLKFSYRSSALKKNKNLILLSAILKLKKAKNQASLIKLIREKTILRSRTQPTGFSAGCVFINPTKKVQGKLMSAGELIDKAGLKGKRINEAEISKTHANFFINIGGATASDIIALINLAKKKVYEKFKIRLAEEIEIVE